MTRHGSPADHVNAAAPPRPRADMNVIDIGVPAIPVAVEVVWHGQRSALEQIRFEAVKAAREQYEQRFAAYKKAQVAEIEKLRRATEGLACAVGQLRTEAQRSFESSVQQALRLALAIARKLTGAAYEQDAGTLARIVHRVAARLADEADAPVTVRLHPKTNSVLQAYLSGTELSDLVQAGIAIVEDESVPEGAILADADRVCAWWHAEQELEWLANALWAELGKREHDPQTNAGSPDEAR